MAEWKPITLVLDSNEVSKDWYFRGLNFKLLRYLRETRGVTVSVPALVVEEVIANHGRGVAEALRSFERVSKEYRRLGIKCPEPPSLEGEYRAQLKEILEEVLGYTILPWPETSHESLVARAVSRIPPFNSSGGGYRDSLIWESVLEYAEKSSAESQRRAGAMADMVARPHVILVSHDLAFAGRDGRLSEALGKEAEARGLSVELVRDLQAWIKGQLPLSKGFALPEIAADVRDQNLYSDLMYSDFPHDLLIEPQEIGLPTSTGDVLVADNDGYDLERRSFRKLPDGKTLVEYGIELYLTLDADMSEGDSVANGWDFERGTGADRVWAKVRVKLEGELEAIFDQYDQDYDFDIGPLRRVALPGTPAVGPSSQVPTVESWNVPLPLFQNDFFDADGTPKP